MNDRPPTPSSPIARRAWLSRVASAVVLGSLWSSRAEARCVLIPLETEIARSRYVLEVEVVRLDAHAALLRVRASWKGRPPETITVSFSARSHPLRRGGADTTHIVFVHGASDERLTIYPCGASGILDPAMTEALRAAGLTRREP